MDCDRGLFLPHVTRRFDTTLDKFGNPDKNVSVGLLFKHFVGNHIDSEIFKSKEIALTMHLMIDNKSCVMCFIMVMIAVVLYGIQFAYKSRKRLKGSYCNATSFNLFVSFWVCKRFTIRSEI